MHERKHFNTSHSNNTSNHINNIKNNKYKRSLFLIILFAGLFLFVIILNYSWMINSPESPHSLNNNNIKDKNDLRLLNLESKSIYTNKLFDNKYTYKIPDHNKIHKNLLEGNDLVDDHQHGDIDPNEIKGRLRISYDGAKVVFPELIYEPDESYPPYETLLDELKRWNPDDPDGAPNPFYETLQVFDWTIPEERKLAELYRNKELPFKIIHYPDLIELSNKWTEEYIGNQFNQKGVHYNVQQSNDNHFMYWTKKAHPPKDFKEPTKFVGMKWNEWIKIAHQADEEKWGTDKKHYYLMTGTRSSEKYRLPTSQEKKNLRVVNSKKVSKNWVVQDLPFFSTPVPNYFIPNVIKNKGIQCRFSMRGVISECHYDTGKNFVAMIRGAKRYVLNPPDECQNLAIIRKTGHPSWRHSEVDWSNIEVAKKTGFGNVKSVETVVRKGELLYIPSFWFHYIQSLSFAAQCNSRAGIPEEEMGLKEIEECVDLPANWQKKMGY